MFQVWVASFSGGIFARQKFDGRFSCLELALKWDLEMISISIGSF